MAASRVDDGAPFEHVATGPVAPVQVLEGKGAACRTSDETRPGEEETRLRRLWQRYARRPGLKLRNELVDVYRCLVDREARRIAQRVPKRVDARDLHTAGIVGLIDAIQNFDVDRQVAFEAYGRARIRGAMLDELRRTDWMPRTWRSRLSRRSVAAGRLRFDLGREPTDEEMAAELSIPVEEYRTVYGAFRGSVELVSGRSASDRNSGWGGSGWGGSDWGGSGDHFERMADPRSDEPETRLHHKDLIAQLMSELSPQERDVVFLRYFRGWTMARIGRRLKISESRVCRIHGAILERMKRRLESKVPDLLC